MKILFLTKELPYPINSGARMRTCHYLRGLSQAGQVHMICYGNPEGQEEGLKVFRDRGIDVMFEENTPPWQAHPLILARLMSVPMPFPYSVLLRTSKILKERIRAVAQDSGCDLIICDGIHMSLNVPLNLDCRKILDEHNVESTIIGRFLKLLRNPFAVIYAFLEWLKFRRFERSVWPRFDEVHVCSEVDKQQVERRSQHGNVKVVPNGVDVSGYQMMDTKYETSKRLVYSGLMGWRPNDDAAMYFIREIYPRIKKQVSEDGIEFKVVGKDPSDSLQKLAEGDPSVLVTGFVDDVKPYIYGSDVFVVPLRIGSGTRLKILEAMAMGKAIVSTSIGCEGLDVTHGENIFIADDPQGFADCVVQLLNDVDLRTRISQAGRRLVEEVYDWKLIETNLAKIIKENG